MHQTKLTPADITSIPEVKDPITGAVLRPISPENLIKESDRNYDLGRKHKAGELADEFKALKERHAELYKRVEAYLCTPNTTPAIKDAFDSLVDWFQNNKRPDGSAPFPVSPESSNE